MKIITDFTYQSFTLQVPTPKMVKHNPAIRLQIADELFECVLPFCRAVVQMVNVYQLSLNDGVHIQVVIINPLQVGVPFLYCLENMKNL